MKTKPEVPKYKTSHRAFRNKTSAAPSGARGLRNYLLPARQNLRYMTSNKAFLFASACMFGVSYLHN